MKLGEPTRQLEFKHKSRLVTRRTGQKYLEQTRVETRVETRLTLEIKESLAIKSLYILVLLVLVAVSIFIKVRLGIVVYIFV
jgi:hypothetical protein